jgi:ribosomal protein L22
MTEVKENKMEEKKTEVKKKEIKRVAKDKACANGYSMRISTKHVMAICDVIRGKSPEWSIERLERVLEGKDVIPMPGREVAHKKGKGIAGAKYPKNASEEMIQLLKQLAANASVNGIENPVITLAKANVASRPYKSHGRKAKRTHVSLEVMDKTKLVKKKK